MRIATLALLAAAAVVPAAPSVASPSSFPDRPVVLVVGYVPGGPADTLARKVASELGKIWHQSVVVENRPGATATIANAYVAKAAPDGYTLLVAANDYVTSKYVIDNLPYEMGKSHVAVGMIATAPNIAVVPSQSDIKTPKAFMAWVKEGKGLTYASTGVGSTSNLAGEMFKKLTGANILHIPYKGVGQWLPDFMSGRITMAFPSLPSVTALIDAKQIRVIAVAQKQRSTLLPDVPTFAEVGLQGFDISTWWGLMAPRGTPPKIVEKINADLNAALNSDDVKKAWKTLGVEVTPQSPAQFAEVIHKDEKTLQSMVSALNLKSSQ
ncbi:tripartite tricarboxylate transporter substrate binding protein [Bordetella genomosp. 10]|nr:tripartite tricarboxylate transporter substrate binding protein [Bordetella genomosp. 10]